MRPLYRARQLWVGLTARPLDEAALTAVRDQLSPAEWALFLDLPARDQQHGYRVWRTVMAAGHTHPALLKAALLHDVGKNRVSLTLLDRCLIVLGQTIIPDRVASWGAIPLERARWWQRPFVVRVQHPAWSGLLLKAAGSDDLTIDLVRRHQDPALPEQNEQEQRLAYLQWADDQN